jgi:hypothetical protein
MKYVTKGPGPWWGFVDVMTASKDDLEFWEEVDARQHQSS